MTGGPALFLPGPVPDRTVWAGWNHWRLTRRNFVPAPVLTAGAYARMTPRQRRLHDLHRIATHSNLLIPDERPGLLEGPGADRGQRLQPRP